MRLTSFPALSAADQAALKFLDAQVYPLNAYSIGDEHIDAVIRLANYRVGGRKIISARQGRQGFIAWQLTDAGRAFVRGEAGNAPA